MIARTRPQFSLSPVLLMGTTLVLLVFVLGGLLMSRPNPPVLAPNVPALAPNPPTSSPLPLPVGAYLRSVEPAAASWMRASGMTWAAFPLEYQPDATDALLEQARTLIDDAHEAGFQVLLTISGQPEALQADDAFATYAAAVGQVAALGADAIEVWQEPNLSNHWQQGEIDPARYVDLLHESYDAIKAANPDTRVISAAPAPTGAESAFVGDIMNDDRFYQGMADADAAHYADCIGVHYGEGAVAPTATQGDPRDDYPTRYFVPMLQRAAAPFRDSGVSLCVTEFGYLSPDGLVYDLPEPFVWANDTTPDQQAAWVASAIDTAAQLSSVRVDMMIVYRMIGNDEDIHEGYALIRPDGSCGACEALVELRQ